MKSLNLLVLAAALFIALPASAQQVKPITRTLKTAPPAIPKKTQLPAISSSRPTTKPA